MAETSEPNPAEALVRRIATNSLDNLDKALKLATEAAPKWQAEVDSLKKPLEELERKCRERAASAKRLEGMGLALSFFGPFAPGPNLRIQEAGERILAASRLSAFYETMADDAKRLRMNLEGTMAESRDSAVQLLEELHAYFTELSTSVSRPELREPSKKG
jgi:DNA repair exonuclease SbcCD ATPase subunit